MLYIMHKRTQTDAYVGNFTNITPFPRDAMDENGQIEMTSLKTNELTITNQTQHICALSPIAWGIEKE